MDFGLTKEQQLLVERVERLVQERIAPRAASTISLWRRRRKTSRISIAKDGCWPISNENAAGSAMVYTATIRWHFFCSTNNWLMATHQRHIAFRSTTMP